MPTPRVLGVDDFALRRGQTYGTLLVDLERHTPIDVLKTREAEPLVAWLQAHPGVQVFVRDRAEAYANAGRRGAPNAVQVADRFHLCQNVSAALDDVVRSRKRRVEIVARQVETEPSVAVPTRPPRPAGARRQRQLVARAQRVSRWEQARELRAQGHSLSAIARQLGINRKTVRQLVRISGPGRQIGYRTVDIFRVAEGQLAEHWDVVDQVDMLTAIGALAAAAVRTSSKLVAQRRGLTTKCTPQQSRHCAT